MKQLVLPRGCSSCKYCCEFSPECSYFSPLFTKEQKDEALKRGLNNDNFKKVDKGLYTVILKKEKGYLVCPLLDRKNWECRINGCKPFDCSLYPFILMRDKKGKAVIGVFKNCPGINKMVGGKAFQEYVYYLKKTFESEEFKEFIQKYPKHIWNYEEEAEVVEEIGLKISMS